MIVEFLVYVLVCMFTSLFYPKLLWLVKSMMEIRRMQKVVADMPGPSKYPFIGGLPSAKVSVEQTYNEMVNLGANYGPIARAWFGPILVVGVGDPQDIEAVLTGPNFKEKFFLYDVVKPTLGEGLAVLNRETWKQRRRIVAPSFHLQILENFVEHFHAAGKDLAQHLESVADGKEVVDLFSLCVLSANQSMVSTILSSAEENYSEKYSRLGRRVGEIFIRRLLHPWYLIETIFSWTELHTESKSIQSSVESFAKKVIKKKREEIVARKGYKQLPQRKLRLLDHMHLSQELATLRDEEIFQEVKSFLMTGASTVTESLVFLFYTLAIMQDVQDKVVQELTDIFGDDVDRSVTYSDLSHMEYLDRVIKEMLRVFPIVPFYGRACSEDTKMPSGYTIPKGASVLLWVPYTHMNAANFPNPTVFDPDRFLPEVSRTRHQYSYIPFSFGSRSCMGQRYIMMLLKTVTATVLRRVRILIPEGGPKSISEVPLSVKLTLSIIGDAKVKTERRLNRVSTTSLTSECDVDENSVGYLAVKHDF